MKKNNRTFWIVDDCTVMPLVFNTYEEALECVNKYFDGETERIYKV